MSETIKPSDLIEYLDGHGILTIETAQAVCQVVHVPFSEQLVISWRNRNEALNTYGFVALQDKPGQGVSSLDLSYFLCRQLKIEAPGQRYSGVGSQARANARAIIQDLSRRGIA